MTGELREHYDVFVSCALSSKLDEKTGELDPEMRKYLEKLLKNIRGLGMTAFCAIEHDGWKQAKRPNAEVIELDLTVEDRSDQLVAVVGSSASDGRADEVATARTKGKPVFFLLEPGAEGMGFWNQGLVDSGRVPLLEPDELEEALSKHRTRLHD